MIARVARFWPLLLLALYLLTPNRQYQFDALDYATAAKTGTHLFHPHHVLYNAFGWLICRLVPGEPLRILATVNAIFTVAAAVLLARVVGRATGSTGLGRAAAVGYALTHGAWYMATAVEVYPISIFGEMVALTAVLETPARRAGRPPAAADEPVRGASLCWILVAGLGSAVGMLFHQTALFSVPAIAWIVWQRQGLSRALVYLAVAGLATGGVYVAIAAHEGAHSLTDLLRWLTAYAHTAQFSTGTWGGGLNPMKMAGAALGIVGTFVFPSFVWNIQPFSGFRPGAAEITPLALSAAAVVLFVTLMLRARKGGPAPTEDKPLRRALALWWVSHAVFTVWWESVNFEFWLMALAPFVFWLALRLKPVVRENKRRAWLALALFGAGNLAITFIPDTLRSHNGWLSIVELVDAHGRDGDIVYSNEPAVDGYLRYFGKHKIQLRSLRETGGDPAAIDRLAAEADAARPRGAAFLLETETLDAYAGVPQDRVRAFWTPRMAGATVVGDYFAWGRRWHLYQLH